MPDVTTEIETLAHYAADGEDATLGGARRVGGGHRRATWASSSPMPRPAAAPMPTRPPSVGVPSIDGLGPVGGNDHTPLEYIEQSSIVPRTTLLAALVLTLGA